MSLKTVSLQILLIAAASVLGFLAQSPLFSIVGTGLLGCCLVAVTLSSREHNRDQAVLASWLTTLLALTILPVSPARIHLLDPYHSIIAWLIGGAVALTLPRAKPDPSQRKLKLLVTVWALSGALAWIVSSYLNDRSLSFHAGLLFMLVMLFAIKRCFRLWFLGIQISNFCIVVLVGLPLADFFVRQNSQVDAHAVLSRHYYSYKAAKQQPVAFANWWRRYLEQWDTMMGPVIMLDPTGVLPFRLRPNSVGFLFESRISINSLGFRGPEFDPNKENTYRIVALGESTTFGCTLTPEDRPWPEVLEQLIRDNLRTSRRVEVINAGVPAYNLKQNIGRLREEILPLRPDMVISYHGANGFRLLDEAMPPPISRAPSPYRHRPLKLLADSEYRLKMILYRRRLDPKRLLDPGGFSHPLKSRYAEAYRELIDITGTNQVQLVIANYSMAVNNQSDTDIVEFYRIASPAIHWQIRANAIHTEMLRQLTALHPEVRMVDTHPHLDGDPDNFIDPVHMTQPGRQRIAENIFNGIKDLLLREAQ